MRVNAQLIDATSGGHVWADRYDGELKNIFGLQDTVTRNVVKALAVELTKDDQARVASGGTTTSRLTMSSSRVGSTTCGRHPGNFAPRSSTSRKPPSSIPTMVARMRRSPRPTGKATPAIGGRPWASAPMSTMHSTRQSSRLSRRCATRHRSRTRSRVRCWFRRNSRRKPLSRPSSRSRRIPTMPTEYIALARALSFAGRSGEALEAVDRAMRLNPHYPSEYEYQRGLAQFGLNRIQDATQSLERAVALNHDDYWSQRLLLGCTYGLLGRRDDATRLASAMATTLQDYRDPLSVRRSRSGIRSPIPTTPSASPTACARPGYPRNRARAGEWGSQNTPLRVGRDHDPAIPVDPHSSGSRAAASTCLTGQWR